MSASLSLSSSSSFPNSLLPRTSPLPPNRPRLPRAALVEPKPSPAFRPVVTGSGEYGMIQIASTPPALPVRSSIDLAGDIQAEARAMTRAVNSSVYTPELLAARYGSSPIKVLRRTTEILAAVGSFGFKLFLDQRQGLVEERKRMRAVELRRIFTRLGPTFVKIGQGLSTRPDICPPEYLDELSELQLQTSARISKVVLQISQLHHFRETGSSMVIEHCATRRTAQPPAAQRRTQRGSNRARPERRIAQMSEEQREAQRERNRTRQRIRRARMTEEQQARQRGIWRDAARRRRAQLAGHNQSEPTTHATTPDNEANIATTPVVLNNKDGCSNISWAWPNIECTKRSAYIRHPNILNTDRWRYVLHDYLLSKTSIIPKSYNMRVLYDQLYKHGLKGVAPHIIKPSLSFVKASLRVFEQLHSVYTNHDLQLARAIAQTYFALIQKRGSPQGEKPCRSGLIFTA